MAPVVDLSPPKPVWGDLTTSSSSQFPSWTTGDDNEHETEHDEAKRELDEFRTWARKRRHLRDDTSRTPLYHLAKRGRLDDAAGAKLVGAVKRGSDSSHDNGSKSEESGHDSDDGKHENPPPSEPAKPTPPSTPSVPATPPQPLPPLPPPEFLEVLTDIMATATTSGASLYQTDAHAPMSPSVVNNDNRPYPQIIDPTPDGTTSLWLTETTPAASSVSLPLLTPVVTVTSPTPALTSGARKGVESAPTKLPVLTVTESAVPTSTSTSDYDNAEPVEVKGQRHNYDDGHDSTDKALMAIGSIGAIIIAFFAFWLAWKCFKLHRRHGGTTSWTWPSWKWAEPPASLSKSLEKPKQFVVGLASRVPVLKKRLANRSWTNLDKPYDDAFWEKRLPASDDSLENMRRGITVQTAFSRNSEYGQQPSSNLPRQAPNESSTSSTQPQTNTTLRSNYKISSISDVSSLSSGFGDGDIIMPPANKTTVVAATPLAVPQPVAQRSSVSDISSRRRETVYTEASEDPVPRFRSINSWVRQQSGRVKRAKQRDGAASDAPPVPNMPLEQDFGLMMPDGEEPRRVETTTGGVSGYGE